MKKWEGENENANGKFMREKDLSKEMEGGRVLNFVVTRERMRFLTVWLGRSANWSRRQHGQ